MRIALTGGIGTGKSFVANMLCRRGIEVYDCDAAAKRIMVTSTKVKAGLKTLIGAEAYRNDGSLNKAVVAQFLLASEGNAAALNAIVHPAVAADFMDSNYLWMECAILYESGFDKLVDKVIAVTAPVEVRLERVMTRDGLSREAAKAWIDKQLPQDTVAERADWMIINDGVADVNQQIDDILQQIHNINK